jgi:hypothetical protein
MDSKIKDDICDYDHNDCKCDSINHQLYYFLLQ